MIKFELWKDKFEFPTISIVVILCISVLSFSFFTKFTSSYGNANWQSQTIPPAKDFEPTLVLENLSIYPLPDENAFTITDLDTGESQWWNARSAIAQMHAVPIVGKDGYHLVWLTVDNQVWHAQISKTGEVKLFPEQLAEGTVTDFDIASIPSGGAMVVWRTATEFNHPLSYAMLAVDGIPYRRGRWLRDVDQFALATAPSGDIVLVWLTNLATTQRLNYTQFDFDTFRYGLDTVLTDDIHELNIFVPDTGWISDFDLVGTADNWLVVWGQTNIATLEQTDYFAMALTTNAQPFPLRLKDTRWRWLGEIGYSDPRQQAPEIVLNGYVDDAWRPVRLQLGTGGIQSMDVLTDLAAEGSRVRMWIGENRADVYLSWLGFDTRQEIRQILAVSQFQHAAVQDDTEESPPSFWRLLLEGLGWLVLPLWLLVVPFKWPNSGRRVLMILGYWTVKLGLSQDALHIPPELWGLGLDARWRIAFAASVAAVLPVAWLGRKHLAWQVGMMAYLVSEMLITVILFTQT